MDLSSSFSTLSTDVCLPGSTSEIEEERPSPLRSDDKAKDQLHVTVPQRFYTHGL